MDTDKKIIMQVAAKIAADMVSKDADTDTKLGEFALLFTSVKDIMFEAIEDAKPNATMYDLARSTFNVTSTESASPSAPVETLQIVGKQHGDIPDWLIKACKRDGVSKVYDNRDGLAANAKRPWFRAVEGEKAYWAPKTRG